MAGMMPAVYTQPLTSGDPSMPAQPMTACEREEIRVGLDRGESVSMIVGRLGQHRCTINREIRRNGGRSSYSAVRPSSLAWRL